MMKKIMYLLFLSCLKATELIEKGIHFKLSFREKLQLKMHKMMCDACANFEKQSKLIEKGIENQQIKLNGKLDAEQLKNDITLHLKDHK